MSLERTPIEASSSSPERRWHRLVKSRITRYTAAFGLLIAAELSRSSDPRPAFPDQAPVSSHQDVVRLAEAYLEDSSTLYVISGFSEERREDLQDRPEDLWQGATEAVNWAMTYQEPPDQESAKPCEESAKKNDCNDHARRVCARMAAHGLPMYYVSLKPLESVTGCWHQLAACKLSDGSYVLIDNAKKIIVVQGMTLEEYFAKYYVKATAVVPVVGISQYRVPVHENFVSRLLVHARNSTSESGMEAIAVESILLAETRGQVAGALGGQ